MTALQSSIQRSTGQPVYGLNAEIEDSGSPNENDHSFDESLEESFRPLSQLWDIKAFKGKGAFRSLAAFHRRILEQIKMEMTALSLSTERVKAECFLRVVYEKSRGTRLRWCVHGQPSFFSFEGLAELLATFPPQVAEFFTAVAARADELTLLEGIHRNALKRIQDFLRPTLPQ